MPFSGTGVFVRLYSWVNDAAANIKIRADRMDAEMNGMATGLSTCITKDGQTTITDDLPFAGHKWLNVADAAARDQFSSLGQVQDGNVNWVAAGGTADAITANYSPALTALENGQLCFVRATAANATTTPTFSPNGLTAKTITKNGNQALIAGDIAGAGHEIILRYNSTSDKWELLNPTIQITSATIPNNSVSNAKLADMATQTIKGRTTAGTGDPEDLTAAQATAILDVFGFDSGSGGPKGLVPAPAAGDTAAGKALFSNGWQLVPQQARVYISPDQTIVTAGSFNLTHNLGQIPTFTVWLRCTTAEQGYSIGDIVEAPGVQQVGSAGASYGLGVVSTATAFSCRYGSASPVFYLQHKTTGGPVQATNANWNAFIVAARVI